MQELSTKVNEDYVIIFFDGKKKWINKNQADFILEQSCSNKKGVIIDGSFYAFSSIAKLLSAKDYYDQFPEEIRSTYSQFDDLYGREINQPVNKPVLKAKELIRQNFIQYHLNQGKTQSQAEEKWEKFIKNI